MVRVNETIEVPRRSLETAVKKLEKGLHKLQTKGWCQGALKERKPDGSINYCAWGAVAPTYKSHYGMPESKVAAAALLIGGMRKITPGARALKNGSFDNLEKIFSWNDTKGRNAKQVKTAFRHAIRKGRKLLRKG